MKKYETNERGFYYLDIVDRYQNKTELLSFIFDEK